MNDVFLVLVVEVSVLHDEGNVVLDAAIRRCRGA